MRKGIGFLAAALAALSVPAWSEATPAARKWLDVMAAVYDKAPLSADFELTVAASSGTAMSGATRGKLLLGDRKHQRVEMQMAMGTGSGTLLSVTDGEYVWTEMNMGFGKQVLKFALEDAEKMAATGSMGLSMNAMDPISQIEQLTRKMDVELVSVDGGKVTLSARMTKEAKESMGASAPDGEMILVLDEKSGYPMRVTFGGDQPMIKLETTRFEFLDESEVPAGAFSYTPPEGVPVMDARQLMGMMEKQGNPQ